LKVASASGVSPLAERASSRAPSATSAATASPCPASAAKCIGVWPPGESRSRTFAPAFTWASKSRRLGEDKRSADMLVPAVLAAAKHKALAWLVLL